MGGGTRKAVKKTCRGHVFRPWESPRKSNGGPQGTGRRFPKFGTVYDTPSYEPSAQGNPLRDL